MTHEQRIYDLEDKLKQAERRIHDLRAERDRLDALVAKQREYVDDAREMIDQWIDAFDMVQNDKGEWCLADWMKSSDEWYEKFVGVRNQWNKFVPEYNAVVAPKRRNFGRPLAASPSQRDDVLKRHKAGHSLRSIAEDTNLGLRTVRTIVDKADGVDRATLARLQRIAPDKFEEARERLNRRARAVLARRVTELQKRGAKLRKKANE
jgi:hypothetical protein